ncbi:serine/threonine-protein kinase [Nocardiopsis sp. CC223A]|uniref:serine/threonine-protein kinase n=1 Tax=Nocardiopsis sp. CC223A TaxID=3044051 RepID=UPI00278C8C16|nr:serine/threonine-protein kinase [Nocardiopsis sp. CC223A]
MNPDPRPFGDDSLPPGATPPAATDPDRIGPYRVVGRIGAGGMGAVYAGIDQAGACAAVKVVHPQYAADPDFRARFAREVSLVASVSATCTAAYFGADTDAEAPWMATEYVPGDTLRVHVRKNGPLTGGMAVSLAAGLAEALVAIHAAGVVHRDLKPGNVILSPSGPKVLDFGIARATDGTALTRTGGLFGTPGWMAPEQYNGVPAGERSDVFAWACLVAFAATGRDPFAGGPVEVVIHRTRTEEPDLTGVPPELLPTVRRALSKDPADRPTAAQALAEVTGAWSATRVDAPPVSGSDPTRVVPAMLAVEWRGVTAGVPQRIRRPRRALLLSAGAAGLAAALVAAFLIVRHSGGEDGEGGDPVAGGDPGAASSEPTESAEPAITRDPGDVAAVTTEALALAEEAPEFYVSHLARSAETIESSANVTLRYTEDPQPVLELVEYAGPATFFTLHIGEGPDDVLARTDSHLAGVVEGDFYRPGPQDPEGDPSGRWEEALAAVEEVLSEEADIAYQGVTDTPFEDYPEELLAAYDVTGRSGHHYTGTAPAEVMGQDTEVTFDLWVDEDGRLQHFQSYASFGEFEEDAEYERIAFVFGQPVEIAVPDESEIAAGADEAYPG